MRHVRWGPRHGPVGGGNEKVPRRFRGNTPSRWTQAATSGSLCRIVRVGAEQSGSAHCGSERKIGAPAIVAPQIRIREIELFERAVAFRLPFRFGAAVVHRASEAFVRLRIEDAAGRSAVGYGAELLVPYWFDKDPHWSLADHGDRLRRSVVLAAEVARAGLDRASAFALSRTWREELRVRAREHGLPPLLAGLGPALLERALLDAVCRLVEAPFERALRANAFGLDAEHGVFGDLHGFDLGRFLARLRGASEIAVRHTIGLDDPVRRDDAADGGADGMIDDGLPESLEEAIEVWRPRHFKVKVAGASRRDGERLLAIAAMLDEAAPDSVVTLDGNESFADVDAALALLTWIDAEPRLARFAERILYFEQPLPRARALATDVRRLAARLPVVIDESDDDDDAFVAARAAGYAGVSIKACKGVLRAVANAARCAAWNAEARSDTRWFVSSEDLTTQAGLGVQQDLVLASALGCAHAERNGHWYVGGMPGASEIEQRRFAAALPDLYDFGPSGLRLRVAAGRLSLASLGGVGFASSALPEFASMQPLRAPDREEPPLR